MRVDMLTREYPPEIYGGAGVHVTELVRALRPSLDVEVRAFGAPRSEEHATGYTAPAELAGTNGAIATLATDLVMLPDIDGADLVHSHTWYANGAGMFASQLYGIPHVATAHSLEPLRPWKAEQLGGGYRVSSFLERTALESADRVIAVSNGMRADILRAYPALDPDRVVTIYNGIDTNRWRTRTDASVLDRYNIDPARPTIIFVGRITRQKGLPYLLRALALVPADVQVVLCAGAPDTPEILAEVRELTEALAANRDGIIWIEDMLPVEDLTVLLSAATVFVCPSIYEPLGIVNLEAMACGLPVVGTGTGGIPEVVLHGETGLIVPIDQADDGTGTPLHPDRFVADLASALTELVLDPERARTLGEAGRVRATEHFSWAQIATQTLALYRTLISA